MSKLDEFEKRLKTASANGIARVTAFYNQKAREAVGVPNPGRRVSAKQLRKQALKAFNGKRTAGLVRFKFTDKKTGEKLESTQWYDTEIDNNKRTGTIYPYASKPGEPPRKRSGVGQASIQHEVDRGIPAGRVGVKNAGKYMIFLNFGTKTIAARPWIDATLQKNKAVMAALLRVK
jgi:HK97 gp10 family phage protein